MTAFSERYDEALAWAARAHRAQLRKGTDIPYITHVAHVSVLLIRYGYREDVVIAGLLHDIVEDCGVRIDAVAARFGPEVARLVASVSGPTHDDGYTLSWEETRRAKLALLRGGGPDVAALKTADALHNVRTIVRDLRSDGPEVWMRFRGTPQQTLWYYREIMLIVRETLGNHPLAVELSNAVAELAQEVPSGKA